MPQDPLADLEQHLDPTSLMSLDARGLLPPLGSGHTTTRNGAELVERIAGGIVGAAIGSALGIPWEWKPLQDIPSPGQLAVMPHRARYGADVQLLRRSLEAHLEAGLGGAPALAERLRRGLRLRHVGPAVPAAITRLQEGRPWFEAGVGSFGSGAIVRAVAVGFVNRTTPPIRPIAAALDCVVTHATVQTTAAAGAVADLIALFLDHDGELEPAPVLNLLKARPELGTASDHLARRLSGAQQAPSEPHALDVLVAALGHTLANDADPERAILAAISAGGDTDTTAALAGAFCGTIRGLSAIPDTWLSELRSSEQLISLGERVAGAKRSRHTPQDLAPRPGVIDGLHISVLLDRSGSMRPLADDVVGGFNEFLAEHRGEQGCRLTLVQFDGDDPFEVLLDDVDVQSAGELRPEQYQPRGTTPLYDAIGSLLDGAEGATDEASPDQVVVVFTDGLENASSRWTHADVFRRIAQLQASGWTFVFMGANQDSYAESRHLGMSAGNTSNYHHDPDGVRAAWSSISRASLVHARKPRPQRRADSENWYSGIKEAEWER